MNEPLGNTVSEVGASTATTGPWESTPTYPEGEFVVYSKTASGRAPSECKRVAYVYEEADARLIAAAPDMLAALQNITGILQTALETHLGEKIGKKIRAAIAKATGTTDTHRDSVNEQRAGREDS